MTLEQRNSKVEKKAIETHKHGLLLESCVETGTIEVMK